MRRQPICGILAGAAVLGALLVLAGCGKSSSSDTVATPPAPLLIADTALGHTDITGTWFNCFFDNGAGIDTKEQWVISGGSIVHKTFLYSSIDTSCSTGEVADPANPTLTVTTTVASDGAMTNWLDSPGGAIAGSPPQESGAPNPLLTTPTASLVNQVAGAQTGKDALFVDSSGIAATVPPGVHLYRGANSGACALDVNGFPACLLAVDFLTRVEKTYTVGGSITGLTQSGMVLQNKGGDDKSFVNGPTSYTFTTGLVNNDTYAVTVLTQPPGLICTVSNGTGTIAAANVTNANISCTVSPFTASNLVAELTAAPTYNLSSISAAAPDAAFRINVPVDDDTAEVSVLVGYMTDATTFTTYGSGTASVTPGTLQSASVAVTWGGTQVVNANYFVEVLVCTTTPCDLAHTGTFYLFASAVSATNYTRSAAPTFPTATDSGLVVNQFAVVP